MHHQRRLISLQVAQRLSDFTTEAVPTAFHSASKLGALRSGCNAESHEISFLLSRGPVQRFEEINPRVRGPARGVVAPRAGQSTAG